MTLRTVLTVERVAAGLACAGVLFSLGCADGPALPTGPSSRTAATNAGPLLTGQEGTASSTAKPSQLLIEKTCDAADHCTVVNSIERADVRQCSVARHFEKNRIPFG